MILNLNPNSFLIFDLDDTLFPEIDFLLSGYRAILRSFLPNVDIDTLVNKMLNKYKAGEDVFDWLLGCDEMKNINIDKAMLIKIYREHTPVISLNPDSQVFLDTLKEKNISMGLITDGRSITQRNKLRALGIESYFMDIIISEEFGSEKPCEDNYFYFEDKYPNRSFYFFGDNTSKDFIVPRRLGWQVVCIRDDGCHIHKQDLSEFTSSEIISSFLEIKINEI